jgi:ribosomal protein L37AE/L43A
VFFEELGVNWRYEKQGYKFLDLDRTHWLPDFEIERPGTWDNILVEVKHKNTEPGETKPEKAYRGLCEINGGGRIFDQIKELESKVAIIHGRPGVMDNSGERFYRGLGIYDNEFYWWFCPDCKRVGFNRKGVLCCGCQHLESRIKRGGYILDQAHNKASKARFEHGETPA